MGGPASAPVEADCGYSAPADRLTESKSTMERNNKGMIVLVPLFPRVIEVSGCLMIVADGPASAAEIGVSVSPAPIILV